jgi:hypothetical protein
MKNFMNPPLVLGLASSPSPRPAMPSGPTRPTMFPPTTPPPRSRSAPCRPSWPARSSPARTSNIPGRSTSTSRWPRLATCSTSFPATAAATARWATPACAAALRPARHRMLHLRQGRLLRLPADQAGQDTRPRFAPPSPATSPSTKASIWKSNSAQRPSSAADPIQ